jgi:hypothetical protein
VSEDVAVPRASAEPPTQPSEKSGEGLSVQTLIIAALASAIAAIVVARFWEKGTIIASAMTPVVVAIVSEALRKPIQSEVVRRPVRAVGSTASARVPRVTTREEARPPSGRTPNVMAPPPAGVDEGLRQREEGVEAGPVKVYSSGSHRRPPARGGGPGGGGPGGRRPLKVAVVTGLIAFLLAAAALTLPELIFGGSVTGGDRGTTYFGGGESSSDEGESQDGSSDGQPDSPTQQESPSDGDEQAPGGETAPGTPAPEPPAEPAPTTTQPPPESPTQTAPAP